MLKNRDLAMQIDVRPVIVPIDLAAGANTGLWSPVRNFARVAFIYFADAGAASEDPTITLRQATDAAGTGAKNATAITRVYSKQHATALPSTWTVTEQAAAATYTNDTSGETINIWVIEIDPALLDVAGGFDFISCNIADTGATTGKFGGVLFLGLEARYASDLPATAA
jgi:hypothetical protein